MSLDLRALELATRVGQDIRFLRLLIGDKTTLVTVDKSSLVNAINELKATLNDIEALQAEINSSIDDDAGASVIDKFWSADKIIAAIERTRNEIVNGAPEAYDTLKEIADYLAINNQSITDLLLGLAKTVRFDAEQALLDSQKQQACDNIGIGAKDVLVVDTYVTAKDAIASVISDYVEPDYVEPDYVE